MSARHRIGKLLLRHDVRFEGTGRNWTRPHLRVAVDACASSSRARRRPLMTIAARSRRCSCAATELERLIAEQLPLVAVGADRAAVAVSARHRHADRGRAVRRDRRLQPLRAPRAADELSRRRCPPSTPPATGAGRARSPRPAASTPAGCWSRRPGTTASRHAVSEPLRRRQAGADAAIVALAWKTQRRLHRVWARMEPARQAPHDHRRRRRPRARRVLLGDRHRLTRARHHVGLGGGGHRGPLAPEHP